jgi:hypothetical protein
LAGIAIVTSFILASAEPVTASSASPATATSLASPVMATSFALVLVLDTSLAS